MRAALIKLHIAIFLRLEPTARFAPDLSDAVFLAVLAVFCTVGMYVLQLQALQTVGAFTVNLSYNLEPVYSIVLAALLLGEGKTFTGSFYVGLGLILLSVALQTRHVLRQRPVQPSPEEKRRSRESVRRI